MDNLNEIVRYGIAGAINAGVGFFVYSSVILIGAPFWVANMLAMISGVISGYFLSRKFVFSSSRYKANSQPTLRYIATIFFQYLIGTAAIGILISLGVGEIVSYVLILPVAVCISYILQKLWVFR